jgi:hypothetical protein
MIVNQEVFNYRKAADANDNKVSVTPAELVKKESVMMKVPLINAHHRFELLHSKVEEVDLTTTRTS